MGCDIHMIAEVRVNGVWNLVSAPRGLDEYCDSRGYKPEWFAGRSYATWTLLAGVRNRHPGLNHPIKEPTYELPEGSTQDHEEWRDYDRHSVTSYTLRELLDYDWDTPMWTSGHLPAKEYIDAIEKNGPDTVHLDPNRSWEREYVVVNDSEKDDVSLEQLKAIVASDPSKTFYVWKVYRTPAKAECSYVYETLIPALQKLGDPEDVRIICGFDS
jgi:hypothetical protein